MLERIITGGKGRRQRTYTQEVIAVIKARDVAAWAKMGGGSGERNSDSGYIIKVQPVWFADSLL